MNTLTDDHAHEHPCPTCPYWYGCDCLTPDIHTPCATCSRPPALHDLTDWALENEPVAPHRAARITEALTIAFHRGQSSSPALLDSPPESDGQFYAFMISVGAIGALIGFSLCVLTLRVM
jgi:hypothetical protein